MDLNNLFNSDVFNENLDIEKLLSSTEASGGGKNNIIYRPSLGKSGVTSYQATLKFLPDYKNPSRLWIKNYEVFLTNQDTNTQRSVHCPSTIDAPSVLQDAFFAFYNSDIAREKKLAKKMGRAEKYYSLIQVIKDKQHPDLEGRIMVFQYGKKIADKIKSRIKPESEDITANQPFDILKGRLFMLSMYQDGEFPNYDKSEFSEKTYPGLKIDGKDVPYNKENQKTITDFLVENTPDMSAFE